MMVKKIFLIFFCCVIGALGCDRHSSSTTKPVDTGPFNAGKSVYNTVEAAARDSSNGEQKVIALRSSSVYSGVTQGSTHKQQIIDSVNTIFEGYDVTAPNARQLEDSRSPIMRTIYDLIREGTLPDFTNALGRLLQKISQEESNMQVIADFLNTRCGLEPRCYVVFLRRALRYPKSEELFKACASLISGHPDFLQSFFRVVSELMTNLPANDETALLLALLSQEMPLKSEEVLGPPAWLARLDTNGNPAVRRDEGTVTLFLPFVDKNNDGICDVNEEGKPVDKNYHVLDVPAFGKREYVDEYGNVLVSRDAMGRGIAPNGEPVFEYYNAKKSVLGFLLYNVGEAFERGLIEDCLKVSTRAFLPKKPYQDKLGPYMGFSDEGDGLKAAIAALDLLKKQETLQLMKAFATLIAEKPATARKFFTGMGIMLCMVRDQELSNPDELKGFMMLLIIAKLIPELAQAIEEMVDIEVPGTGGKKMDAFFVDWFGANLDHIGDNVMWPLRTVLRKMKSEYYPSDPYLVERLYANCVAWALGDFTAEGERKLAPVLPILLTIMVYMIEEDPAIIGKVQDAVKTAVTSRCFAEKSACYEKIEGTPEAKAIFEALTYYLTPKNDPDDDVYGELCCLVAMLQFKDELIPKIRLLNMVGRLLAPEDPVVIHLLNVLGRMITKDNAQICLRSMRAAVAECHQYGFEPLTMFVHAAMAVHRVDYPHKNYIHVTPQDVRVILADFQDVLLNQNGLLQKVYRVLGNKK